MQPLFSPSFLWKEVPRRGGGWPRKTVLPHSRKPTPPRFARLPLPEEGARMIFKETLIQSLPFPVRVSRFPHICRAVPLSSSVFHTACALSAPTGHLPRKGNAIKLSGRTFLAPHRGSCPKGLCKRTGFLGVKRRENPVRRHFERSEMRGLRSGIA